MNIDQAKEIALSELLDKLGSKPSKVRGIQAVYSSPLRHEKTPSFFVNTKKNVWFDHGTGEGGSVLDFAMAYLKSRKESATIADALRWLKNMGGFSTFIQPLPEVIAEPKDYVLELKETQFIEHKALHGYLKKRGISREIAAPYLQQVRVYNKDTKKSFFALGMKNEEGGYEIRNPYFKGSVGPKALSFIRGSKPKPEGLLIFEGTFDFLSVLQYRNMPQLIEDTIILHSLSNLKSATPYIQNYGYRICYTWLDNDPSGAKATDNLAAFCKTEDQLLHRPMNSVYVPHNDVNSWLLNKGKMPPQ